ncbi:MAG TPA: hypothetical protein VGC05_11225 [Mycobacterium sp.]
MRLIVARCSAAYSGRLDTVLPEALRLIMVKADGSVLLHADAGGYKPLNWAPQTVRLADQPTTTHKVSRCRHNRPTCRRE